MIKRVKKKKSNIFSKPTGLTPTEQEFDLAEKVGGYRLTGSGAFRPSIKGNEGEGYRSDVDSKKYRFECKQTKNKSMSVTTKWIERATIDAITHNKRPAMHLYFKEIRNICSEKCVMIEESEFLELLEKAGESEVKKETNGTDIFR